MFHVLHYGVYLPLSVIVSPVLVYSVKVCISLCFSVLRSGVHLPLSVIILPVLVYSVKVYTYRF